MTQLHMHLQCTKCNSRWSCHTRQQSQFINAFTAYIANNVKSIISIR